MRRGFLGSVLLLVYVVVGVVVAGAHSYYAHATTARAVVSAVLAIFLWPLVLLGISLHIR